MRRKNNDGLPLSEYLTTTQAARVTGLTVTSLARLARKGKLGAVRKGFAWLFPKDAIYNYRRDDGGGD